MVDEVFRRRLLCRAVETGADARRKIIRELWVPDGLHFIGVREARGYDELLIIGSHEKNISVAGNSFCAENNAKTLRNGVTFNWEMISPKGDVLATNLGFLIVDDRPDHGRLPVHRELAGRVAGQRG